MRFLRDSNENKFVYGCTYTADDATVEGIEAQTTMLLSVIKRQVPRTDDRPSIRQKKQRGIFFERIVAVCMLMMCVSLLNYAPVLLRRLFDQMPIVLSYNYTMAHTILGLREKQLMLNGSNISQTFREFSL